MTVLITLTTAGTSTGPFSLYSNVDSYSVPFETGVLRTSLLAGYTSTVVPNGTTTIRVMSTGTCTNYTDISVVPCTTTTTTTVPPTTTTTTTSIFSNTIGFGGSTEDACLPSASGPATGNSPVFCSCTTFTGAIFAAAPTGTWYVSFGGQYVTVSVINGNPVATVTSACSSCTP
jgi:sugar phosphate permease